MIWPALEISLRAEHAGSQVFGHRRSVTAARNGALPLCLIKLLLNTNGEQKPQGSIESGPAPTRLDDRPDTAECLEASRGQTTLF